MDMPLPLPLPEPEIIMPLLSRRPFPVLQPVSLPLPRGAESLAQSGERQPLEELTAEDRFMLLFSKVERLTQRMAGMAFLGNFQDNLQMLTPVRLSPESWWSAVPPPNS